jgi:integrase
MIRSQVPFDEVAEDYLIKFVQKTDNLASSTRAKYKAHLKNHIRPAFKGLALHEVTATRIEAWLQKKADLGLSWATRTDLRNIISGMFTQAKKWGYWKEANPVSEVSTGKKRAKRQRKKLSDEATRRLLATLPSDVRLLCLTALVSTLRISELLGLQEKHLNFAKEVIEVRQRYWRGDLDDTKTDRSTRDVPMGHLVRDLRQLCMGDPERFVFGIVTTPGHRKKDGTPAKPRVCRDDRDIHQHFLRPAAKTLGLYFLGFGFHSLRREAITNISQEAGIEQASLMAGHTSLDMTLLYELADLEQQKKGSMAYHERLLGNPSTEVKQ